MNAPKLTSGPRLLALCITAAGPFRRRLQVFFESGAFDEYDTLHSSPSLSNEPRPLRPFDALKAHGGERRLDRVGSTNVVPVFGRKIIEGQKLVLMFGQGSDGLGILGSEVGVSLDRHAPAAWSQLS